VTFLGGLVLGVALAGIAYSVLVLHLLNRIAWPPPEQDHVPDRRVHPRHPPLGRHPYLGGSADRTAPRRSMGRPRRRGGGGAVKKCLGISWSANGDVTGWALLSDGRLESGAEDTSEATHIDDFTMLMALRLPTDSADVDAVAWVKPGGPAQHPVLWLMGFVNDINVGTYGIDPSNLAMFARGKIPIAPPPGWSGSRVDLRNALRSILPHASPEFSFDEQAVLAAWAALWYADGAG